MRLSLGAQTRQAPLLDTLYRVYEAKRASEVAPGVGLATDIAVISKGAIKPCDSKVISKLKAVFETSQAAFPSDLDSVREELGDIT
jgi:hypothetical protein